MMSNSPRVGFKHRREQHRSGQDYSNARSGNELALSLMWDNGSAEQRGNGSKNYNLTTHTKEKTGRKNLRTLDFYHSRKQCAESTSQNYEANDAFTVRPWPKCDALVERRKVLYNLLFVVWPQVSTCGKKEPASNTLKSGACATGRNPSYAVVPHGDFKTLISSRYPVSPSIT